MTSTLALSAAQALSAAASLKRKRLGVVIHSYWQRWHGKHSSIAHPAFTTPMDVLDHVRGLGVGSLQITVHDWKDETAADMRATSESYGVKLEGSVGLPKNADDVARFEHELRLGKAAGMTIFRSWIGGRRYEDLSTREAFEDFKERAMKSLRLAEPLVRRHGVRLGVENHKDFHAPELVEMLSKIGFITSQVEAGPPGMIDGPLRAPSSPPETPAPMKRKPRSPSHWSRRSVSV